MENYMFEFLLVIVVVAFGGILIESQGSYIPPQKDPMFYVLISALFIFSWIVSSPNDPNKSSPTSRTTTMITDYYEDNGISVRFPKPMSIKVQYSPAWSFIMRPRCIVTISPAEGSDTIRIETK